MKISLFYEFPLPRPWSRRRRAPAVPGRPRRGRGGRQGGLLDGVADRAPLPRGVLPLDRAGDVPGRGEPAHQGHSARLRRHAPAAADQPSGPHRRARRRRWTTCPTAASSSAPVSRRRSASSAASTSTPPTSARMWEEALEVSIRCMTEAPFTGFKGEHVEMPARNVIPKPLQKPHPPVWVACTRPVVGADGRPEGHRRTEFRLHRAGGR